MAMEAADEPMEVAQAGVGAGGVDLGEEPMAIPDRDPDVILTKDQVFLAVCEYLGHHGLLKHRETRIEMNIQTTSSGGMTVQVWEVAPLGDEPPIQLTVSR